MNGPATALAIHYRDSCDKGWGSGALSAPLSHKVQTLIYYLLKHPPSKNCNVTCYSFIFFLFFWGAGGGGVVLSK